MKITELYLKLPLELVSKGLLSHCGMLFLFSKAQNKLRALISCSYLEDQ